MRKVSLLIVFVLVFSLVACNDNSSTTIEDTSKNILISTTKETTTSTTTKESTTESTTKEISNVNYMQDTSLEHRISIIKKVLESDFSVYDHNNKQDLIKLWNNSVETPILVSLDFILDEPIIILNQASDSFIKNDLDYENYIKTLISIFNLKENFSNEYLVKLLSSEIKMEFELISNKYKRSEIKEFDKTNNVNLLNTRFDYENSFYIPEDFNPSIRLARITFGNSFNEDFNTFPVNDSSRFIKFDKSYDNITFEIKDINKDGKLDYDKYASYDLGKFKIHYFEDFSKATDYFNYSITSNLNTKLDKFEVNEVDFIDMSDLYGWNTIKDDINDQKIIILEDKSDSSYYLGDILYSVLIQEKESNYYFVAEFTESNSIERTASNKEYISNLYSKEGIYKIFNDKNYMYHLSDYIDGRILDKFID